MQLISKFNKGFRFLLCVIEIYSKYAWVIPLKDKKGIAITNTFQKFIDESKCKPNKIWVNKGSEFSNRSIKSWLEKNAIEMYSTHNGGKSVIAERFIRTLLWRYFISDLKGKKWLERLTKRNWEKKINKKNKKIKKSLELKK